MKDWLNTFNRHAFALTNLYELIVKEFHHFYPRFNLKLSEIFSPVLRKMVEGRGFC
jgi:hypothetical protein